MRYPPHVAHLRPPASLVIGLPNGGEARHKQRRRLSESAEHAKLRTVPHQYARRVLSSSNVDSRATAPIGFVSQKASPRHGLCCPYGQQIQACWPPSVHKVSVREPTDNFGRFVPLDDRPFVDKVPRLLRERGLSIRALARAVGVTDSHLSRVMRHANYKTPGPELARRVATALGLPPDYFPEYRKGFVLERIRTDAVLRDELYAKLTGTKT